MANVPTLGGPGRDAIAGSCGQPANPDRPAYRVAMKNSRGNGSSTDPSVSTG